MRHQVCTHVQNTFSKAIHVQVASTATFTMIHYKIKNVNFTKTPTVVDNIDSISHVNQRYATFPEFGGETLDIKLFGRTHG